MEAGGQFQDRFLADRGAFLREESDGHPPLEGHQTIIRLFLTEDEFEQGGFSGAIRTDKTQTVLPVELE